MCLRVKGHDSRTSTLWPSELIAALLKQCLKFLQVHQSVSQKLLSFLVHGE